MFFLRRVELWIIDFRSGTAELALPEKFAASGGACGGLTTACGSNLNPAEQRVVTMLRHHGAVKLSASVPPLRSSLHWSVWPKRQISS